MFYCLENHIQIKDINIINDIIKNKPHGSMNIEIADILENYKKDAKIFNYIQSKDKVEITINVGIRRYITYWLIPQELANIEDCSN